MTKKVLIIGLGHLASFFCEEMCTLNDFEIIGTYRNLEKVNSFNVQKIFFDTSNEGCFEGLPRDVDYVLLNLPVVENYSQIIEKLNKSINKNAVFIFVSSTSVYGQGEVDEDSKREGQSRNAKTLIALEDQIKLIEQRNYLIIRPGGLIDEKRNPAKSIAKRGQLKNSDAPINLVHTRDVARFIVHCISNSLLNSSFNLVSDNHISKREFYSGEIKRLNLSQPSFGQGSENSKIVANRRAKDSGFIFLFPNLKFE